MSIVEEPVEIPDANVLLAEARQGNAPAFCQLVEPLEARLLRQALALCRNTATAEDLVSETLIQAWKSLANYNQTCRFSTWLYSILLHRYQKTVRAARSRPVPFSWLPWIHVEKYREAHELLAGPEMSPARALAQQERTDEIRRAVE